MWSFEVLLKGRWVREMNIKHITTPNLGQSIRKPLLLQGKRVPERCKKMYLDSKWPTKNSPNLQSDGRFSGSKNLPVFDRQGNSQSGPNSRARLRISPRVWVFSVADGLAWWVLGGRGLTQMVVARSRWAQKGQCNSSLQAIFRYSLVVKCWTWRALHSSNPDKIPTETFLGFVFAVLDFETFTCAQVPFSFPHAMVIAPSKLYERQGEMLESWS